MADDEIAKLKSLLAEASLREQAMADKIALLEGESSKKTSSPLPQSDSRRTSEVPTPIPFATLQPPPPLHSSPSPPPPQPQPSQSDSLNSAEDYSSNFINVGYAAMSQSLLNSPCASVEDTPLLFPGPPRITRNSTISEQIPPKFLLSKEEILLLHKIGKGSFGEVWKGVFQNKTNVAVKQFLHDEADVSSEVLLLSKATGKPNVIDLIGVVVQQQDAFQDAQVAIVTRFCENGSLHDMLVNCKSNNFQGGSCSYLEVSERSGASL